MTRNALGIPCARLSPLTVASVFALAHFATPLVAAPSPDEFFAPAPDLAANYPPGRIYPQGRIFPLSLFSAGGGSDAGDQLDAGLDRVKADRFTMIGPQYELDDRALADARRLGLPTVYGIDGREVLVGSVEEGYKMAEQSAVEDCIRRKVEAVMDDPRIAWWYLTPEELRYWREDEIRYLEIAADTIREVDPLRRPVWMYDPGHRDAPSLVQTGRHLDILGKGAYTNYAGRTHARVWVRWGIEQEVEAIKTLGLPVTPILVPEMFEQPPADELELIESWVRHDVYLGLLTGAKGVVVFSMRKRPNFDAHERYYQAYARVARELCGRLNLGQVFLFGERRDDLRLRIVEGPRRVSLTPPETDLGERTGGQSSGEYPSVGFAAIAHGRSRYLFAVNSAEAPVKARLGGLPLEQVAARDLFSNRPVPVRGGQVTLEFAPLEARCLRFTRTK